MVRFREFIGKTYQYFVNKVMGTGLIQEELTASGDKEVTPGMPELVRQAAAEGCVLLKNNGVLPLSLETEIAVFGRCQLDWFYVGYGSGGDVSAPYYVNLIDGLKNAGANYNQELADVYETWCSSKEHKADHGWWGHWPMSHPEMPVSKELLEKVFGKKNAVMSQTSGQETAFSGMPGGEHPSDIALVVIGRAAGEDRENTLTKGSYYLTDEETALLDCVTEAFTKTIVILDTGSVMDLSWIGKYGDKLSALLIAWFGGMESGNAVCDVLYGKVSPCGKLSDTIARSYEDYPSSANFGGLQYNEYKEDIFVGYRYFDKYAKDKVLYPFGYGLSYTKFQITPGSFRCEPIEFGELQQDVPQVTQNKIMITVPVQNVGKYPGKEVVALWCCLPETDLVKPVRVLSGFAKTKELQPGEETELSLTCEELVFASFEEATHSFVLDAGTYTFYANDICCGQYELKQKKVLQCVEPAMCAEVDLKARILERLPAEIKASEGDVPKMDANEQQPDDRSSKQASLLHLKDVAAGKYSLEDFIAGLSPEELEALTRGQGMMNSSYGVSGNAGAFGGIISSLNEKGVKPLITSDGPAGLRLRKYTSLIPCGAALASTWNTELVEKLLALEGSEMKKFGVDVLLAPGMNIHRNPLCGRNFEYYSEDPVLSGKMAAAAVRGVQSAGLSACPKHFACNNQEVKRNTNDSRVSERALREIYLKNFEICIKEGQPLTLMTSYNKVNGVWSHYNYDLATTILRGQWGYEGVVVTDWWMQKSASPEFPVLRDNAYRVRAQVDVLMPGDMGHFAKKYKSDGTLLETLGKPNGITKAELQRSAKNVLRLVLKLKY